MKVCLGSDHRGVQIKARLVQTLQSHGFTVIDEGTDSECAVDYPDYAIQVARRVSCGEAERGILICGTGIGMSIAANKFPGVRAAPCYDEVMVEVSRRHNNVNVLCLPGDLIGERPIDDLVLMWLRTEFEGGRHEVRVKKIDSIKLGEGPLNGDQPNHDDSGGGDSGENDSNVPAPSADSSTTSSSG